MADQDGLFRVSLKHRGVSVFHRIKTPTNGVLEVLAAALAADAPPAVAIANRRDAQAWLRTVRYHPSALHLDLSSASRAFCRGQCGDHRSSCERTCVRQLFGGYGRIGVRLSASARRGGQGTFDCTRRPYSWRNAMMHVRFSLPAHACSPP
ncbi:hypothetical protein XAP412_460001 [Xanthomonas phaseoli pv. phaseoli]|uniref:Transposase n=1 Tax=Xanthomonas campestris pv. phaseoli TaxID=317013 RepID=A0AB38E2V4_XANCH|nr:hypothetical protein XAP6984_510001 [Xanthomonas phaseoli pv. phaseoli]SON85877.1 hypothetical protein XAP412_460001 [Xanthomonas phaseoli pv. phaseoli]SON90431.1 hypothetical protein XAP7430_480001 [Xanthomonas phaseoli pv. phaseoli]SOO28119.1 hypothetical protein XAP6164_2150009 [Xanthomonas phaseoli pv. phaseoli]